MSSHLNLWPLLAILVTRQGVLGYYCRHDVCISPDQYCCGDNLCCDYANSSWYLWILILAILLALSLLYGLFCVDRADKSQHLTYKYLKKFIFFITPRIPAGMKSDNLVDSCMIDLNSSNGQSTHGESELCIV